jgi:hypothetical protein
MALVETRIVDHFQGFQSSILEIFCQKSIQVYLLLAVAVDRRFSISYQDTSSYLCFEGRAKPPQSRPPSFPFIIIARNGRQKVHSTTTRNPLLSARWKGEKKS